MNNDSTGNSLGNFNTAVGAGALFSNVDGDSNNAVGVDALASNTTGLFNNAMGFAAMGDNITGSGNVAVGDSAGAGNTSGDFNTYLGVLSTPVPDGESDTIRIGDPAFGVACFVGGIFGVAVTGDPVVVDGNGQLGVAPSSQRFKQNIQAMGNASNVLLALRPVTFRYKKEIDSVGTPQFGLVAEEVEKVNAALVVRDKEGKPYTVRYDQVNAMLLNEFLKEHRKVEELEATVAQRQKKMETIVARLKEQESKIQKVSAWLELNKATPQTIANKQ
jgi:hypothetical protein